LGTEAKIKITGDEKDLVDALDNSRKEAEKLQNDLSKIAAVGAVAFAGFAAGIALAVNEAAKFETIEAQFTTLTGSINIAKDTLKDLKDFSAKTPFQFEDIANAGRQLIAFGTPATEVRNRLQEIGDVAAASGAPIGDLTLIFGQVAAAGKLTGERLLQLQERAVPIGPALAKTLGIAESEVKEFVSAGKVGVKEFNEAFASLSEAGGFAFKGIEAQSNTLNGLISTLKDNFSLLAAGIGQELLPAAKIVVKALIDFLSVIRENEESVKTLARVLAAGAGMAAFVTALALGGIALVKIKLGLAALRVGLGASRIAAAAFTGALTLGLGFVIAFLPEIIEFLKQLVEAFDVAKDKIIGSFKDLANNLLNVGSKLGSFLKNIFQGNFGSIADSAKALKEAVNKTIDDTFEDVKEIKQQIVIASETKFKEGADADAQEEERLAAEEARAKRAAAQKIALKKEEGEALKIENKRIADEKRLEAENEAILAREEEAALEEEFRALDDEDRLIVEETRLANLTKDELKRREVLIGAAKSEVDRKKKARAQFIQDELAHGKSIAQINKLLSSSEVASAKSSAGQLSALASSKNSTLAGIGRAAAVTQIGIDSAAGAASIFAKLNALFPILAPVIGGAGAAAIIAFGAEKISNVRAAQAGGLVPGSGRGDIVPSFLEPGEIVIPRALSPTFSDQFSLEADPDSTAARKVEVRVDTIIGTEQFVNDSIIPAIKDGIELENADIGVA